MYCRSHLYALFTLYIGAHSMLQCIVPGSGYERICRNGCMKQNTIAKVSSLYGFISYSKLITLDAILLIDFKCKLA